MKKTFIGSTLMMSLALFSCSSEQNVTVPVRLNNLVNTGCKASLSAKESRPDFYQNEMGKTTKMTISADAKGIVNLKITDIKENCGVREIRPQIDSQENVITIILTPFIEDPSMEADCICNYDVSFNLSNLSYSNYHLKVYRSDYYGNYNPSMPSYEGNVILTPNCQLELELK
ncbi:MAG: hypothetical protein Q4F85_04480 [Prevotella sp.]|nr:hypothetical protein [Prevotella sp.]MDO5525319.1 hypothetical protein [Prevotella sp.]